LLVKVLGLFLGSAQHIHAAATFIEDFKSSECAGCWFESLAVASRPLQRRPRRNGLGIL